MSIDKENVATYYDGVWKEHELKNAGKPNSRHRTIFRNLKKEGLNNSSSVIEIGCGIGSLSRLIISHLSDGFFVGTDIAPQTIELLKKIYPDRNRTDFILTDMSNFSYSRKFDFVVLPDVLEHIPVEVHPNIFKSLQALTHPDSVILINNPYPLALEYLTELQKDQTQIIDIPLHINHFSDLAYKNGFYIEKVEPYSLWTKQFDYQNIVIKPKKQFSTFEEKNKLGMWMANIGSRL